MNPILVERTEPVACPACSHRFPLSEGLSHQAIERHADAFEKGLAERRRKLEAELAAAAKAQLDVQLKAKDAVLDRFRSEELQLRRQLHELAEAKKNVDVDYQRKLDEEMKRREALFQAQIASAQREVAELKRKLEQGSQQLQGEALELSLESVLKSAFPLDEIVPVPKGMYGADLLQHVRLPSGLVLL